MRAAIDYLRAHASERPEIDDVARGLGMSPSRFRHAFADWTGITPKHFLAFLTKAAAKKALKRSDVLTASHRAGLSGPGRLHELLVTYEAVSPGEFKSGDIAITYGLHPCPFGWCLMGLTKRGICNLLFLDSEDDRRARKMLMESWPKATLIRDDQRIATKVDHIFSPKKSTRPIPLLLKGTNFQIKVWEALLKIPSGTIASYAAVARAVGSPGAVRAVGSACGKNPVCFLIPCHRVLASDGGIGGYNGGIERKEALLLWEAARK